MQQKQKDKTMKITFKTHNAEYDTSPSLQDYLTLVVKRIPDEPEPDQNEEAFIIQLNLSTHTYQISPVSYDYVEMPLTYPAEILFAFAKAFAEAYALIDATCSPLDVFDEPLIFSFEAYDSV